LEAYPPELLFFYIPQIVQNLRHDENGYTETTIMHIASVSSLFAHQVIWNMMANMYIDDAGTVADSMKPTLDAMVSKIVSQFQGSERIFYEREFSFFEKVTGISGLLKPFIKKEKWEKKKKIDEELAKIEVDPGVYLPSNPESCVVDIDYSSGRPLQSFAKVSAHLFFVLLILL
jgi:phosphatidylinositol 4-kinase A